jgi:hypothetical protein
MPSQQQNVQKPGTIQVGEVFLLKSEEKGWLQAARRSRPGDRLGNVQNLLSNTLSWPTVVVIDHCFSKVK